MSEQLRILEMIEKGQITAAEGMELLNALNNSKESEEIYAVEQSAAKKYKFLRIRVTSDNNKVNVNVNIPLRIITTLGKITNRLVTVIPADARKEIESQGIDINSIDITGIIEDILNGTIDDPNIIDVESWDEHNNTMVRVRIYVD